MFLRGPCLAPLCVAIGCTATSHKSGIALVLRKYSDSVDFAGFVLTKLTDDIKPSKKFIIYPGEERYELRDQIEVISLAEFLTEITASV